ncbi:MAG: hypothetical protein OXI62_01965, partial [Chloroflexota bacterium]|nr:hypothetical protein [Chloroflexota bacterium]MDE2649470.1 hypothetical protein [Chloroflexota bacterium]
SLIGVLLKNSARSMVKVRDGVLYGELHFDAIALRHQVGYIASMLRLLYNRLLSLSAAYLER